MPATLRSRLALLALLGAFLIPLSTSSLRGLTHLLTCRAATAQPFDVTVEADGGSVATGSTRITREQTFQLCGGLVVQPEVRNVGNDRVEILLPITNGTSHPWRGTVSLKVGDTTVPVDIGAIPAGQTRADTVTVRLRAGTTRLDGTLLIGP